MGCCNGADQKRSENSDDKYNLLQKDNHSSLLSKELSQHNQDCNQSSRKIVQSPESNPRTFRSTYFVGEELGSGATAVVRKCTDRRSNTAYAVKIIDRSKLCIETESMVRKEVSILRMLNHPNIVKCYDFFEEEKYMYMIEEFVKGGDVYDRISKKNHYSEKEARDCALVLLNAIKHCHDKDVVHRDLKLDNLLLAHEGDDAEIKVADFGFSTIAHENTLFEECGTLDYIAPEVLSRKHYGKPCDVWSCGVCIYILLCGHYPFYDDSDEAIVQLIIAGELKFHEEYWSGVSEEAKDLLRNLLVVDQYKRYTIDQALQHPWINIHDSVLDTKILHNTLAKFKSTVASIPKENKFNYTVRKIISSNRRLKQKFPNEHASPTLQVIPEDDDTEVSDRSAVYTSTDLI
jgi:serine/threonine protein kinase